MTLALFLLGLLIIFVISRYNESNKLFWSLLTCYIIGFSAGVLYHKYSKENKESDVELTQAYPTQGLTVMSGTTEYLLADVMSVAFKKETSKPVSQAITPVLCELGITSSVCGATHKQYFHILPNPPNGTILYDTS
jgi:uncharacterized membrane protein